jgi:septal ring factor EnvC (AmiA/AmiB activator)
VPQPLSKEDAGALAARAADRIKALQRESDDLAARSSTVLTQLRQLEVTRALRAEELAAVTARLTALNAKVAASEARVAELEQQRVARTPALEGRLEALYKRGGPDGYVRLLLETAEGRDLARASRGVVALARVEELRIEAHRKLLADEKTARDQLASEQRQVTRLKAEAAALDAAARKAVADRTKLLDELDRRRELAAQYVGELEQARTRLQATMAGLAATSAVDLPLRPFQGELPWPVKGALLTRFGRAASAYGTAIQRNGIEIGATIGTPVHAVHGGTVAYAAPFTGFGVLVIVDHGDNAFSVYGHLAGTALRPGTTVTRGQVLGASGTTPAGQPAAYFEVRIDGRPVNPLQWLASTP